MTSARLNLLFLFSDQHSHRVAGCYGDALGPTPNLDRLASEGVTFDNAYCPSPICVPSRMSMLTARYPYAQECWTNDDILRSDYATWLHALGASGYRPELIGRLHAMGPDQLHGYAAREIGDHSPNWAGVPRHDMGVLDKANDPWRESLSRSGIGQSAYQVKDAETAAAACRRLEAIAATGGGTPASPFCLSVGFLLPHPPYVAWNEDFERFSGRVGLPSQTAPQGSEHPWLRWWRESRDIAAVTVEETLRARTAYYGLVHRLDILIGQVLDTLERVGLARNTLVVYATDHGDQIGERGLWWKHTLYEESARVPLIMRAPGALPAGERRSQVVNLIDVAVTMLDVLGAPPLPHAQGRSFLEVARDPRARGTTKRFRSTAPMPFRHGPAAWRSSSAWCGPTSGSSSTTTATRRSCSTLLPIQMKAWIWRALRGMPTCASTCSPACSTAGIRSGSPRACASGGATRICSAHGRGTSIPTISIAGTCGRSTTGSTRR